MNIKSIFAAVAVVAGAQGAFAASGVENFVNLSAPGTYIVNFGGDGSGIVSVSFDGDNVTGVTFDGITLVNPLGFYTFDLGSNAGYVNYSGNTHSFTVTGTGAFTGQATWNDGRSVNGPVVAIPEPGTYAMFLAGLAAMGAVARRRRVK